MSVYVVNFKKRGGYFSGSKSGTALIMARDVLEAKRRVELVPEIVPGSVQARDLHDVIVEFDDKTSVHDRPDKFYESSE